MALWHGCALLEVGMGGSAPLLTRFRCAWSEVVVFLILISFSGPFNLALGGFLAVPPLISNSWNPPFGIQGRSWRLESCLQETGDKKRLLCPGTHMVLPHSHSFTQTSDSWKL